MSSFVRAVPKPFPSKSLPLPPKPSSASIRGAQSMSLMGLVGWDGWAWTGYLNCPSIFCILRVYSIDNVLHLLAYSLKKIPTFLWVSKFDVKLGSLDFFF